MDGPEETLPIYHGGGQRTGAANYYPPADAHQYLGYQQPHQTYPLPPPPQAARQQSRNNYIADPSSSQTSLGRAATMSTASRRPLDDPERAYSADHRSFYPAAIGFQPADNLQAPTPENSSFYPAQPQRSHSQVDSVRGTHSPRKQPLSGAPSPSVPQTAVDGPTYRSNLNAYSNHDPYAPPQQPPTFSKPPLSSSAYSPSAQNTTYPSSNTMYTPTSASIPTQAADTSLYANLSRNGQSTAPTTPHSYTPGAGPQPQTQFFPHQDHSIAIDTPSPAPKRKSGGLKRVRDSRDIRSTILPQPSNNSRMTPLKGLTSHISATFNTCNPQFSYESSTNPRRVLTKPSEPAHNEGYDNQDYDYILYVNDLLGGEEGHKYLILDVLGQGTFGQVVKCQNIKTHEVVAVKVVKNKPAYFNQSMMEVTLLEMLNKEYDPNDQHHILRLRDSFIHRNHLCLVFELLSSNLYELIKHNSFSGLSTQLVKVFTAQLLDALTVLKEARLIHCDLKPENILLRSLQSPQIKVIDFGSACHEKQTVYTYIQSRFYRSPEVLLGVPYTSAIDMWSLGCIAVELFLGLPLFPGTSEYNQITRIVEMLGQPPSYMMDMGKQTSQFFDSYTDPYGNRRWQLKSLEQYSREHNVEEQPSKKYFSATTLPEIVKNAPIPAQRAKPHEVEKEHNNRLAFIDFVQGLLNLNPMERWTPQQARTHPFITGDKFTGTFVPAGAVPRGSTTSSANAPISGPATDPKLPYGGLVPAQPKGQRAYQDAAAYQQRLNSHQAYTQAQAAASQQQQQQSSSGQPFRNPYIPSAQTSAASGTVHPPASVPAAASGPPPATVAVQRPDATVDPYSSGIYPSSVTANPQPPPPVQHRLHHHGSTGHGSQSHGGSYHPSSSYNYAGHRGRANTTNQMDIVPPAIARIANMGQDMSGVGRNTLTPVINRDDAMKEWERRQQGKHTHNPYPQLEYLQQQAELLPTWNTASRGYIPLSMTTGGHSGTGGSGLSGLGPNSGTGASVPPAGLDSQERPPLRDVMASVRSAATTGSSSSGTPQSAYTSTPTSARYPASSTTSAYAFQSNLPTSSGYDGFDQRAGSADMASLYVPLQPTQSGSQQQQQQQQVAQRQLQRQATMNTSQHPPPSPSTAQYYPMGTIAPPSGVPSIQNVGGGAPVPGQRVAYAQSPNGNPAILSASTGPPPSSLGPGGAGGLSGMGPVQSVPGGLPVHGSPMNPPLSALQPHGGNPSNMWQR